MNHATVPGLGRKATRAAGILLLSFAFSGASSAQDSAPAAGDATQAPSAGKARVRVFGQNGINIHVYQNSVCVGKGPKTTVGGLGKAFSSLFGQASNTTIGMKETPNTRNMGKRDKLGSKAYFQEFEFPANEPLSISMHFQSPGLSVGCKQVGGTFTPAAGKEYEIGLDIARGQCLANVQEIADNGQGEVAMQAVDTVLTSECK